MTASEMYLEFLKRANDSYAVSLPTWDVANWLSLSQREYALRHVGPEPAWPAQSEYQTAETLAMLHRVAVVKSSPKGFVPMPTGMLALMSIAALAPPDGDCPADSPRRRVPCRYVRDMELAAVEGNVFTRPSWGDAPRAAQRYSPRYTSELATQEAAPGWRVHPAGAYDVELRFYATPPDIAIRRTAFEAANYAGNPKYIALASQIDIHCVLHQRAHDAIVQNAVALMMRAVPDLEGARANAA